MNAAELIEYIRTAEKKTPVKVYIWERFPTSFPNAKVFPAGDGAKIVFGDWRDIGPAVRAQQDAIADIVIESSCRNSAVPLLDTKGLNLIDAGHFATENPVVAVLAEKIAAAFPGIQVKISETHRDCMKFY